MCSIKVSSLRNSFLFAVTLVVAGVSFSQNYTHSPDDTLQATIILDQTITMGILQHNSIPDDTLYFFWNKESVQMPVDWEAHICDNSACFTSLVESGASLPVYTGNVGLMFIVCTPHTNPGTAIIRYSIYEQRTPNQVDTLTWIVTATLAGIETKTILKNQAYVSGKVLFLDQFNTEVNQVKLLDLSGKSIFETKPGQEKQIGLPPVSEGIYVLQITTNNQIINQKIWLQTSF